MNNPHLSSPHPLSGLSELEALAARFLATAQYDSAPPVVRSSAFGSYEAQEEVRDALARYLKMAAHTGGSTQPTTLSATAPLMPSASSTPVILSASTNEENSPAVSRASSNAREGGGVGGGRGSADPGAEVVKSRGTRQIKCSECPQVLLSRRNFIKHAEDEHGLILPIISHLFDSQTQFDSWINQLREEEGTEFVSKCGRKKLSNGSLLGYLVCMRGGCASIKEGAHRKKKTAKSLKTCSAFLKVLQNESGQITVEGCLAHTGHVQQLKGSSYQQSAITTVSRHEGGRDELEADEPIIQVVDDDDVKPFMSAGGGSAFTRVVAQSNIIEQPQIYRPLRRPLPTMVIDERIQVQNTPATPSNKRKRPKEEVMTTSDIEQPKTAAPATIHQPTIADDSPLRRAPYVDVCLERRKLAMLEKFQTTLQKVDSHTIDAAEVATNFFVREMEMLSKGTHHGE